MIDPSTDVESRAGRRAFRRRSDRLAARSFNAHAAALAFGSLIVAGCVTGPFPPDASVSPTATARPEFRTRAELSGFAATSTYAETMTFLERLAAWSPKIRLTTFGRSAQGRPLPLVIVSSSGRFEPFAAREAGEPVILIQSGIHAGEIDGKDASLLLLRDIALGRRDVLLGAGTLLFIPIYNVDGHERVSRFNRPNQDGPVPGMGFRTTSSGLDLNRDHLKLVSEEARAFVRLVNRWNPDLHVDIHVTDGVDHAWVVTYAHLEAPQLPDAVDDWLRRNLPPVLAATEAAGHPIGPYVSLEDDLDPTRGFDSWVGLPRFSTGYFGLRNRPSLLIEMHSYKPYQQRVRASHDFLIALLEQIARDPRSLRAAVGVGDEQRTAAGEPGAFPSRVPIRYEVAREPDIIRWPVYDWTIETSEVFGPVMRFQRGQTRSIDVPWYHKTRIAESLPRPRGYLVMPGWPQITERLLGHGLRVACLAGPADLDVETMRLTEPVFAAATYQGLTEVTARVARQIERRSIPDGALWVPADQPGFELAVQLLEPDAPDSLFRWGLLSSVLERKEYIDVGVLSRLADDMLRDPRVRQEWEQALTDPSIAEDSRARYLWWYRRTPYWDDTVGLMPVVRVMTPPAFSTRPYP